MTLYGIMTACSTLGAPEVRFFLVLDLKVEADFLGDFLMALEAETRFVI